MATTLLRTDEVSRHATRLVTIGERVELRRYADLPALLAPGDLVVVNDVATLPASLPGDGLELRLSGPIEGRTLRGIVFGAGDHRTRTEDRPPPVFGDTIVVGGIALRVLERDGRRVVCESTLDEDALWQAIYAHGVPVQYAHRRERLPLYAVQTAYAARPWAAEMPSAGRALTWEILLAMRRRGIAIATLSHAAGLSSTGDPALDAAMPWPERYEIPVETERAIASANRVIAIGTTVARALESSGGRAGSGIATLRLDPSFAPQIVDGIVSGLHEPGESHFELLGMFASRERLLEGLRLAAAHGLSSHELGDACLVMR